MPLSNPDCSISPVFQAVARLICSGFNVVCGENVCGCGDLETLNGGFRSDFGENVMRRGVFVVKFGVIRLKNVEIRCRNGEILCRNTEIIASYAEI